MSTLDSILRFFRNYAYEVSFLSVVGIIIIMFVSAFTAVPERKKKDKSKIPQVPDSDEGLE